MDPEMVATWHTLDCFGMIVQRADTGTYSAHCYACCAALTGYNGVPYAIRASKEHALHVRMDRLADARVARYNARIARINAHSAV